ncbi:hypothetical protein JCM10908_004521 [Rhodotorula pacifica]|uniref:MFS transporter n=1 Tax=Rhodotorula pacifica TaxID=1495444 RepID=UPI00316E05D2
MAPAASHTSTGSSSDETSRTLIDAQQPTTTTTSSSAAAAAGLHSHLAKKHGNMSADDYSTDEAEREIRDWGGDAPALPFIPRKRGMSNAALNKPLAGTSGPHQAPTFLRPADGTETTIPTQDARAGAPVRKRTRSGTVWSEGGYPELTHVDTAFSDAHRAFSRLSKQRSRSARPSSETSGTRAGEGEQEDESEEENHRDPNKVEWEENDPHNPQNWTVKYKWIITILCAQATLVVTFASSAPSSATRQVAQQFNTGSEVAELTTALFLAGYVAGPLLWAPLSEIFGRRPIFILSLAIFVLFQIGCALAQNIQTLIICRFLAAVFASSPLTNAGGVIADVWDPVRRGDAMSMFSASVFLGPVIGPIAASFTVMNQSLRWRWIYGWIAFWGLGAWLLLAVFLPETYHPVLLKKRAIRLRKEHPEEHGEKYAELERADFSLKSIVTRTLARPLVMLVVEPIMTTVTIYLSVVYGLLYGLFSVIPIIFQQTRGFNPGESGLVFIGVGIGTTIGAAVSVWTQRGYPEMLRKWHGHPPPEHRLFGAMLAGPFLIVGIFWLGWTGNDPSIHWAVPAVATIFVGMSFTLVFISFLTYLVEVYLMYSASALSGNTVVRSAVAAAFPLFITQMFSGLGIGWGCTVFGIIGAVIAPSPFLFYKYGWRLRQKSRFAPCLDVGLREQVFEEERQEKERKEKGGDGVNEETTQNGGASAERV